MSTTRSARRTVARIGIGLLLASALVVAFVAVVSAAEKAAPACPPVIASLLPKNGAVRGGSYNASGPMGMGSGAADLPFDHPCLKSEKFPARISVAVTYYGGEMAEMLKMQGGATNEQELQSAMEELKRGKRVPKREKLAGGEVVYVDYLSDCPPEGAEGTPGSKPAPRPPIPNVKLKGVALTANVRLQVELEGKIGLDQARAAVTEVFENLKKADFSKAK
jgi:hypothetical protein